MDSSRRQLLRHQQELENKIEILFSGKVFAWYIGGCNSMDLGGLVMAGSEDELLETISAHQQKLEREEAGLNKVGVVL